MSKPPGRPKSLPPRLLAIAQHIRPTATVIDVGTDHGFIPIYLAQRGHTERLIAMDIAPGPLAQAEGNIAKRGLRDRIELALSDGLKQLPKLNIDPTTPLDIVIAGMGGENIVAILADYIGSQSPVGVAPLGDPPKNSHHTNGRVDPAPTDAGSSIRYLLQPMTRVEKLLDFLAKSNLHVEEYSVTEGRRVYRYFVVTAK